MKLPLAFIPLVMACPLLCQDSTTAAAPVRTEPSGPAILSRGEAPAELSAPIIDFRPFAEVGGVYNNGLAGVGVNSKGELVSGDNSFGVELTGGVSGVHAWKRTRLGLDYRGSFYHFTKTSYYDGTDQSLLFSVSRQMTKHTTLSLRESAGTFTRSFGLLGLNQTVLFDPSTAYIPTTDFFDNRTFYLSTQADFTWQKTARLSFNMGGDGFLNRRRSTALYSLTGASARGDVQYRFTRSTTIGAGYSYSHYDYHGVLSGTDLHSFIGTYSKRITREWEVSAYGGVMRSEITFLQNVAIDPFIALLIGRSLGTQIIHRIDYLPNIGGRLSRSFPRGVGYVSAGRSVSPGNGLFLTSTMTSVAGGYTFTGFRRWTMDAQMSFTDARSLGNIIGNYRSTSGGVSFARRLANNIHLICSVEARRYGSGDFTNYNRTIYTARAGLGFTPGELPLRIW